MKQPMTQAQKALAFWGGLLWTALVAYVGNSSWPSDTEQVTELLLGVVMLWLFPLFLIVMFMVARVLIGHSLDNRKTKGE